MWLVSVALAGPIAPSSSVVPAAGRHEVVFDVAKFGRYAVSVRSAQGASVQLVDALAGPGARSGSPGVEDGRVDLFLDRGKIKVVVQGDPAASGDATVTLTAFTDATPTAPVLPEHRRVDGTLRDLGQQSWWIDVPEARTVHLDVAARNLGDLRLWQDGSWLVDGEPQCTTVTPAVGQPWRRCAWSGALEPGLYLVTAYGGPSQPWANASDAAPMVMRWGGVPIGGAGRQPGTLGPAGYELYEIGEEVGMVSLALPAAGGVASLAYGLDPLARSSAAAIDAKARRPVAGLAVGGSGRRFVVVTGSPGQTYDLTWFRPSSTEVTIQPGRWFVGTMHPDDPADVLDPTGVVYRPTSSGEYLRAATHGYPLDAAHPIERTFNLGAAARLILDVAAEGTYRADLTGVTGTARIRPLTLPRPPEFVDFTESTPLGRGLYEVELAASPAGIATLRIADASLLGQARRAVTGGAAAGVQRPAVQFPSLDVEAPVTLSLRNPSAHPFGLVLRELPIDPREPLPLTLVPGESIEVPVRIEEPGVLYARAVDGQAIPFTVDGGGLANSARLEVGDHVVRVRDDRAKALQASLAFQADRYAPDRPLPALASARLAGIPKFQTVSAAAPIGFDLEQGRSKTLALTIDAHGLYRIESTGLLATEGAVRTRVVTRLAEARANGVGRNFSVGGYLRGGDYQVTVTTIGASAGHLGVRLVRARVDDGGTLPIGAQARATVPAQAAVRYVFDVAEAGQYHLEHRSPTGPFGCRIEDADGWPIVDPNLPCSRDLELTPGRYVVLGLPTDVQTHRLTTVVRRTEPVSREGHGPFAIALGRTEAHVWNEPVAGADRVPDTWTTTLAAPTGLRLASSAEVVAELRAGDVVLGRSVPGEGWYGQVPAGTLTVAVTGARRGSGVPYTLSLTTDALLAGSIRPISAPETVPIAVGTAGVYTITSAGDLDLRARLFDAAGRVVAANDDRPDDWNFQISARLDPGVYALRIDRVRAAPVVRTVTPPDDYAIGTRGSSDTGYVEPSWDEGTEYGGDDPVYEDAEYAYDEAEPSEPSGPTVEMRAPVEVAGPAVGRAAITVTPGDQAVVCAVDGAGEVVVARATSGENVGIAIEVQRGAAWEPLASGTGREAVAVARVRDLPVRVRVWSEDLRGSPVEVRVETPSARSVGAEALASGVGGAGVTAVTAAGGAGQFAIGADRAGLFACSGRNTGCPEVRSATVSGGEDGLVLVRIGAPIAARRVVLAPSESTPARLGSAPQQVELTAVSGVTVVEARAPAGRPVVSLPGGWTGAVRGAAVAVSYGRATAATMWDGAGAPNELDARITRHEVGAPVPRAVPDGRTRVEVPAHGAVTFGWSGDRRVEVALEEGLIATFGAAGGPGAGAVWAEPAATTVKVARARGSIGLLNPTGAARYVVVDLFAPPAAAPVATEKRRKRSRTETVAPEPVADGLVAGHPFERLETAAATWLLPVAPGPGTLAIRGATDAQWIGADGRVLDAAGVAVDAGGTLVLRTEPGPVLAWIDDGSGGPVAEGVEADEPAVGPSGVVPLGGGAVRLAIAPGAGAIASLVAPCPLVAQVKVPGGYDHIAVLSPGERLDVLTPRGTAEVVARPLADAASYGDLVVSSTLVSPIGEGLGPPALVGAGQAAYYSFEVERDGPIGVGVRADSGRVGVTLLDPTGVPRASGLVARVDVTPGTWTLVVAQPPGAGPARIRPAVAGLVTPSTTPPVEVVRQYMSLSASAEQ